MCAIGVGVKDPSHTKILDCSYLVILTSFQGR